MSFLAVSASSRVAELHLLDVQTFQRPNVTTCSHPDLPTSEPANLPTCLGSIPFIFIGYHNLLHSQKTLPPCFQSFPHSASKNRGGECPVSRARPLRADRHARNQSRVTSHLFGHPSHCSQTRLVPQLATALENFTIRGNNSAPP